MSNKDMQLSVCRETPSCGCPVLDARKHRAWHERVFIAEDRNASARQPWYAGQDVTDSHANDDSRSE